MSLTSCNIISSPTWFSWMEIWLMVCCKLLSVLAPYVEVIVSMLDAPKVDITMQVLIGLMLHQHGRVPSGLSPHNWCIQLSGTHFHIYHHWGLHISFNHGHVSPTDNLMVPVPHGGWLLIFIKGGPLVHPFNHLYVLYHTHTIILFLEDKPGFCIKYLLYWNQLWIIICDEILHLLSRDDFECFL